MNTEYVVVDDFLQKAGMAIDEFEDISVVTRFIEATELDNDLLDLLPEAVVRGCAENLKNGEPISYGHLLAETELMDRSEIDLSRLKQAVVLSVCDASISCLVIDFEIRKAYVSLEGSIVDNVCYCEKTIQLTDEAVRDVAAILEIAGILNAEYQYTGDTSYRQDTILALSFPNGIARYESYGIDSGIPVEIIHACNYLIKCFYNM